MKPLSGFSRVLVLDTNEVAKISLSYLKLPVNVKLAETKMSFQNIRNRAETYHKPRHRDSDGFRSVETTFLSTESKKYIDTKQSNKKDNQNLKDKRQDYNMK